MNRALALLLLFQSSLALGQGLYNSRLRICDDSGDPCADVISGRITTDSAVTSGEYVPHVSRVDVNTTVSATGASAAFDSQGFGTYSINFEVTSLSGTNPTVQLETSISDDQINWSHVVSTVRFVAAGSQRFQAMRIAGKYYRVSWIITGTGVSAGIKATTTLKAYLTKRFSVLNRYSDIDLVTLNATSSVFSAGDCANTSVMSARAVDGLQAAVLRIQASNDSLNWADLTGNLSIVSGATVLNTFSTIPFRFFRAKVTNAALIGPATADLFWGCN